MAKKFLYGVLCAVVGGAVTFTGSVTSNNHISPVTEVAIAKAVSESVTQMSTLMREAEERELNSLPDVLNCTHMEWMTTCSSINKQAKKNPHAPVRVKTKDGLEMNFAPGTPSAVMAYMLDPNEATTSAYLDYIEQTHLHNEGLAHRYKAAYYQRGGIANIVSAESTLREITENRAIDTRSVIVNIFYDSTCPHCKTLMKNMRTVKERYPELQVRFFQIDADTNAMRDLVQLHGSPVRLASTAEKQRLAASGVNVFPMTWFDNLRTKKRIVIPGAMSTLSIENNLERISAILTAEK